jgi:glycosyltransferase 2 family protein
MQTKRTTPKTSLTIHVERRQLIILLVLVLLLYVVIPQVGNFKHSLVLISHARFGWIVFGAACYLATSIMSALIYRQLAPRRLPLLRTIVVQYGSSFANRILPAGLGALGVGFFYLRKQKCTPPASLAVVTLNNVLGTAGHAVLLVLIAVLLPATFRHVHLGIHATGQLGIVIAVSVLVAAVLIIVYLRFRRRLRALIGDTAHKLAGYRQQKLRVLVALVISMMLTLLHALCLWAAAQSLNSPVSLAAAVVILGIGVTVGAAIPSPGGLGGAEAGLVAGLVAFGVAAPAAVAIAIMYRLATYWLGFVVGALAFVWSEKKSYF